MAQSAETDHPNLFPFADAPVAHGRVCRDPSAKQRRSSCEIQIRWNTQHKVFIDNDAFGIATVGHASEVLVRRVEGEDHVRAELLEASFAVWAGAVRVDHAADRGEVAWFVLRDPRADFCHTADDLMARYDRVIRGHELPPLVAH